MAESDGSRAIVGFIGLGAMGWPMGACLVRAGHTVFGYDTDKAQTERFGKAGGIAVDSLTTLAERADVLITMLPNSAVVEKVIFGTDGLMKSLRPGARLIEMSSGVPSATREIGRRLRENGVHMVDAPVSGGVKRAVSGELAIMVGGEAPDIDAVEPILKSMGRAIMRTGSLGSGQAMKALNNLVSAAGFLVGIEALLIGRKAGLDPAVMVDVLNASTGRNNSTDVKFKQFVLSRSFNSGFSLDLMVKDLSIALDVAHDARAAAPFSSLCRELWASAATLLGTGQDHTAVARFSEMLAGATLETE